MAFLETKNLIKSFGDGNARVNVLGGISMTVDEGEVCTILGQHGNNKPLCSAQRGLIYFKCLERCSLSFSKVSSLMSCSILQLSS